MTQPRVYASTRRAFLAAGGAMFAWPFMTRFAGAAGGRDPRLVVLVLRGALDGLGVSPPLADPDYANLHGAIALSGSGERAAFHLDGFFGLHPSMPGFARMWRAQNALIAHAVSTPYRNRSHFDGQDVLESGYPAPGRVDSGWLNRAVSLLPKGERTQPARGLAVGALTPLVIRGPAPIVGWSLAEAPNYPGDLIDRIMALYDRTDPRLHEALSQGLGVDALARQMGQTSTGPGQAMRAPARGAARLLAADDGPRVAALVFDGWDTHANEGGPNGRLAQLLSGLDGAFEEFETGLGVAWKDTVIVAITEFGRTARVNGTLGTDHGVATAALLAGGAVRGGRVLADWPGLKDHELHEGRDLRATMDLRALLKGVLRDHLDLPAGTLANIVFPGSQYLAPMDGLIA